MANCYGHGQIPIGRPKLRYSDHVKSVLTNVAPQKLILKNWQLTENYGVLDAPLVWRAPKQHPSKQPAMVVLADTLLLWQPQLDLSFLTVSESMHRTSVSTVIFVFIYDRTTDITSVHINQSINQSVYYNSSRICWKITINKQGKIKVHIHK